jgi:hypothetical protein
MYEATGRELVRSFTDATTLARLLICYEDMPEQLDWRDPRIMTFNLGNSQILQKWLQENSDIIPVHLGGRASTCNCPRDSEEHNAGCSFGWFNRNAARWFRKVVSIHRGALQPNHEAIIWLDSDCVIQSQMSAEQPAQWFGDSAAFYLKSRDRTVLESGIIGFRTNRSGLTIIASVLQRYLSQQFRSDVRWDDGFQFQLSFERHPEIPARDLATHASGKRPFGHVVCNSPIGRYIVHRKGLHASTRIMM